MKNFTNFLLFVVLPIAIIVALFVLLSKLNKSKVFDESLFDESELFI